MRTSGPILALAVAGLTAATLAGIPAADAAENYTVTALHFKVNIGPTGSQTCDIIGDLYTPAAASSTARVPRARPSVTPASSCCSSRSPTSAPTARHR